MILLLIGACFCLLSSSASQLVPPNCPDKGDTICIGHGTNDKAAGSTVADILHDAYNQFCGCQYIQDSVVIRTLSGPDINEPLMESNFSFLYHVKEISGFLEFINIPPITRLSLPNLRIIRGNSLRSSGSVQYGLVVTGRIQSLYMPNLTEITRGSVFVRGNDNEPSLCNLQSVNWTDIAPTTSNVIMTNGCSDIDYIDDCSALGCSDGFCWCNDSTNCCQSLTLNCPDCNGGRCFQRNQTVSCCHTQCAAGCDGGTDANDCQACKNVLSNGECTESCPDQYVYDPTTATIISNPDYRLEARPLCVVTCPSMLYEFDGVCVEQCPLNYMSTTNSDGTRKCINCNGPCPKECSGGIFQYNEAAAEGFKGCQIITSSLQIGPLGESDNSSLLNYLMNIDEIRGSLDISLFNRPHFPYLSNLKIIGSDTTQIRSLFCNDTYDIRSPYAINIANTMLESIDLSSLIRIEGGGVRLVDNPSLCYLGNLSYFMTNSSLSSCVLDGHRRQEEECVLLNDTCHSDCNAERGWCWGPHNTQCVTCKEFKYDKDCVSSCDNVTNALGIVYLYESSQDNTCLPCHSLCNDTCIGEGPDHCDQCSTGTFIRVNTGVGILCLESCLTNTYKSITGECLPCFEGCVQGCTGPADILNSTNGCNRCNTVILDANGNQIRCQLNQTSCPVGYYYEQLMNDVGIFTAGTVICRPCHESCATSTCTGPSINDCITCTNNNGSCATTPSTADFPTPTTDSPTPTTDSPTFSCALTGCDSCDTDDCCAVCSPGYIHEGCSCSLLAFCAYETILTDKGYFIWPETLFNNTVNLSCPSGPNGALATRACTVNDWETPIISSCANTEITNRYRTLSQTNLTADNIQLVSQNLTKLVIDSTGDRADQNTDNIKVVSSILTQTASLFSNTTVLLPASVITMTTEETITVLDSIEEWPQSILQTQSNQILQSFERILDTFVRHDNFTDIVLIESDIAFNGQRIQRADYNGITFTASFSQSNNTLTITDNTTSANTDLLTSMSLPRSILNATNGENMNIVFTVYTQSTLFPVRDNGTIVGEGSVIGSPVIGASVEELSDGVQLLDPVIITLLLTINHNISNPRCVFWDFTAAGGQGNWSTKGCTTIVNDSDLSFVTCSCDHLTNFACLVDISARTNSTYSLPERYTLTLEVVTYIGVCLSLVGLLLTIFTLIVFKKIRQRDVTKFHLQLCIALICLLVVFVIGIDKVSIIEGCITVGVLIHYLTLVVWMWMGAEALLMFQKLVIIFSKNSWKFLLGVSVVCWIIPLIPVVITVAINPYYYISEREDKGFCFLSDLVPFLSGFLSPILIVLIFNFVIYILVIRVSFLHTTNKNKRLGKSSINKTEALKLLLSFFGIMILFGLTWVSAIFTFITQPEISFVIQFVFSFLNAFQGFFIFVFFILLSNDSRDAWKAILCPWHSKNKTSSKCPPQYTVYAMHKESFDSGYGFDKSVEDEY